MKQQSTLQTVAWVIWGIVLLGVLWGFLGASWWHTGMMIGVRHYGMGMMGSHSYWPVGFSMVLASFWNVWKLVLLVIAFVATWRLTPVRTATMPIVFLVLAFLGSPLYAVPGIWGLVVYFQRSNLPKR